MKDSSAAAVRVITAVGKRTLNVGLSVDGSKRREKSDVLYKIKKEHFSWAERQTL